MAITRKGEHSYGDGPEDIAAVLGDYSTGNRYAVDRVAAARCACGGTDFLLYVDDTEGVAARQCSSCGTEHVLLDGAEYLDDAELEQCGCLCGAERFEISVGFALYADTTDVRWVYIGCRCIACGLLGVYADWKTGGGDDVEAFVSMV